MTKHLDPVCGMEIEGSQAAAREDFGGKTYRFCSTHCRDAFAKAPAKYADAQSPGADEAHSQHGHGHGHCCH